MIKRTNVLRKLAVSFLIVAMICSNIMIIGATETAELTLTNNVYYTALTPKYDGSVAVSANMMKASVDDSISVELYATDGTEIASVGLADVLATDSYAKIDLIIHKNTAKYELYKNQSLAKSGAIAGGLGKTIAKMGIIVKGTAYIKNLAVADYMNAPSSKDNYQPVGTTTTTPATMTEILNENFESLTAGTSVGGDVFYNGYNDSWVSEDALKVIDVGVPVLEYKDNAGGEKLMHMLKNSAVENNFEIQARVHFPAAYDGGFRMFVTPYGSETEINLLKGSAASSNKVTITDNAGNEILKVPTATWMFFTVRVDLDAQTYVVRCNYKSGEWVYELSAPIALPCINEATPYILESAGNVGFAKDVVSPAGSYYIRQVIAREDKDNSITVLFSDDFNDGKTGDVWDRLNNLTASEITFGKLSHNGHKGMIVERKMATNISKLASAANGATVYGALAEDGTFTEDTAASANSYAAIGTVVYAPLSTAISTSDDIYVEFDAYIPGKAWKYNTSGTTTTYTGPRDIMYVALAKKPMEETAYMEYAFQSTAIALSDKGTVGDKILPTGNTYFDKDENGRVANGPFGEWVTATINNNKSQKVSFKVSGSKPVVNNNVAVKTPEQPNEINKIAFTIGNTNGGACYLDNIKVYKKDSSYVETLDVSTQTLVAIAIDLKAPTDKLSVAELSNLNEGATVSSVVVNNYTGDLTQNACVIVALYKNDCLMDCSYESGVLDNFENEITFTNPLTLPNSFAGDRYTLRVFLWNGMTTLKPLVASSADYNLTTN